MGTVRVVVEEHPLVVTVTFRVTDPAAFAVKTTAFVPAPAVIVPFVTLQAYWAPGPASATEAPLPVEFGHTSAGAVTPESGNGLTPTLFVPLTLQPAALVTVAWRTTCPDCPAVKRIADVAAPDVIAPFSIVQAYVAPVPAPGTVAVFPAEPAHTETGAEMTADGALLVTVFETVATHPEVVRITTLIVTGFAVPEAQRMFSVPLPPAMVPLVIDQV